MQVRVLTDAPASVRTGALVLPIFSGSDLSGVAKTTDDALGGAIADVLSSGEISAKPFELSLVHAKGQNYSRVLLVGLGEQEKFEPSVLARYAGAAVRYLGKRKVRDIAFVLPERRQRQRNGGCVVHRRRRADRHDRYDDLSKRAGPRDRH